MGRENLNAAIQEAYASADSSIYYLDTLTFTHPNIGTPLRMVNDRVDQWLTLETGEVVQFLPVGFRFILPESGDNGVQELTITVDNVGRKPMEFIKAVIGSNIAVAVAYRPYLSNDNSQPAMNPPLTLYLTDVVITSTDITGRATFADILNRAFLSETYSRRRFPSL